MAKRHLCEIEEKLSFVPAGKLFFEKRVSKYNTPFYLEEVTSQSAGKGFLETWTIFPGVELTHSLYCASQYSFQHASHSSIMQINHCRFGRIGWEMHDGIHIYLGPGNLSLHTLDICTESVMNFPLKCYEGIAITVDFKMLEQNLPEVLRDANIHGEPFCGKFCGQKGYTAIATSPQVNRIFSELYTLPTHMQIPYFKLKVQELLLFLSMLEPEKEKELDHFYSQQIEAIQAMHCLMTEHLEHRYTITELSKQYLMNTTTLKTIFKSVYGAPIATYMKEYRIRQAAQLLQDTTYSIAEIAERVGYENQSKFTSAFRSVLHLPPAAYRKLNAAEHSR